MAVSVTHATVVLTPDDGSSEVGTDEWNASHTVNIAAPLTLPGPVDISDGVGASAGSSLFINWPADISLDSFPTRFQMTADPNSDWLATFVGFGNVAAGTAVAFGKTRGATPTTHGDVAVADALGSMWFYGSSNGGWRRAAIYRVLAINTGVTNMGGWARFEFYNSINENLDCLILHPDLGVGSAMIGGDGSTPTVPQRTLQARFIDATTNTVVPTLRLTRDTYGAAGANGIGTGIEFQLQNNNATREQVVCATIDAVMTDVTNGSEDVDLVFNTMGAGSMGEQARLSRTTTARDTSLMLYDVDNNTLERVTVGIADSGGIGFKVLRIPN